MSTSKNVTKKAAKSAQNVPVGEKAGDNSTNDRIHSSHKAKLTWAERAKLAGKGSLFRKTTNAPHQLFKVRNKNAAIFDLGPVKHFPVVEICVTLQEEHGKAILGLYRLTHLEHLFLEIVFLDATTRDRYLEDGLQILGTRLSDYNNAENRNFLTITLNNVPIMTLDVLRNLVGHTMIDFAPAGVKLFSFCPLIVLNTEFLTNQWQAHYNVTDCGYEIFNNLQKFVEIDGFKVNLHWRNTTKNCFFCDKKGHIKKDCEEWKLLKEQKNKNKNKQPVVDPIVPEQSDVIESDSNEYFTETQGVTDSENSPVSEKLDPLATPKTKTTTKELPAFLSSGSGLPKDSASRNLLRELQTDDEDSDGVSSAITGPGHRSKSSLTEQETISRSDRKKDQIKAKINKKSKTKK